MQFLLIGHGFLGSRAPFHSDLSLILILISAVMFTIGWQLAVRNNFEAHRWIQTGAAILNALVVLTVMIASFMIYILPGIPGKLLEGTYGVTTVHAFIGMLGLLIGIYVVLSANRIIPENMRFQVYRPFMRTSYIFYMLSTIIGVIVYITVYVLSPAE